MNPYHTNDPIWRESAICREKAQAVDAVEAAREAATAPVKRSLPEYTPRVYAAVKDGCNSAEMVRLALPDLTKSQVNGALRVLHTRNEIIKTPEEGFRITTDTERTGLRGEILPKVFECIKNGHATRQEVQKVLTALTWKQINGSFSSLSARGFIIKAHGLGRWAAA